MSEHLQVIDTTYAGTGGGELVRHSGALAPVQSIEDALALRQQIVEFTRRIMTPEHDFGVIPGTNKPTLLKPGAEKLCTHFGLRDDRYEVESVTDWTGAEHGGEPFFAFTVKCFLSRQGDVVSVGLGHCNSWEKKYRYRSIYPDKATEDEKRRGKLVSRPGKNRSTYQVYLVPNDDIFDQVNTFLKMAKKRALIDATLRATSASEFYTQDVEDLPHAIVEVEPEPVAPAAPVRSVGMARDDFEARAALLGFNGTTGQAFGELAVLLLKEKPAKWTAEVWDKATAMPDAAFNEAIDSLHSKAQAADVLIDTPPLPPKDTTLEAMAK